MKKEEFIEWLGIAPDKKGLVEVVLEGIIDEAISDHEVAIGLTHPNMRILLRRGVKSPDSCGLDDTYGVFELYEYVSKLPAPYTRRG